jgi:uncharacterized protein DUF3604
MVPQKQKSLKFLNFQNCQLINKFRIYAKLTFEDEVIIEGNRKMENAKTSVKYEIPSWSNPPLEDHKGYRLFKEGKPEFFAAGTKTFFGDVHVHTNFSHCGHPNNMSLEDNLIYSRETADMDFVCIADHAEHMNDKQYKEYCSAIEEANDPGKFVTLPGYEWAKSAPPVCGHRNVMFRERFGPIYRGNSAGTDTIQKLSDALRSLDQKVIMPRHHTAYCNNWNNFQADLEPVIEIYSSWGNSECEGGPRQFSDNGAGKYPHPGNYVQDGLIRGYQTGFISGGDAHSIKPASNGITAVIAPELTRENIFDAVSSRRCYATTGPKILLDFTVNGFPMGSVIKVPGRDWADIFPLKISCAAIGTDKLQKIEVIENNRIIFTQNRRRGPSEQMAFCMYQTFPTYYWRYYYVRVTQMDGEMAWASPICFLFEED